MTSFAHELHLAIERKRRDVQRALLWPPAGVSSSRYEAFLCSAALPTEREAVALATALCVTGRYWTAFMAAAGVAGEDADAA